MSKDALEIAQAILELKPQSNFFKNYLFLICIPLFSAFFGGFMAIKINKNQDKTKIEREKFYHANNLIFSVNNGLSILISIKSNYHEIKSSTPYTRVNEFPEAIIDSKSLNVSISNFSFIKDIKTCNFTLSEKIPRFYLHKILKKPLTRPTEAELGKTWRNLSRIDAMLSNYSTIFHQLEKRNKHR